MSNTKMDDINIENKMNKFSQNIKEMIEQDESNFDENDETNYFDDLSNTKYVLNTNPEERKNASNGKLSQIEDSDTDGWQQVTSKKKKVLIKGKNNKNFNPRNGRRFELNTQNPNAFRNDVTVSNNDADLQQDENLVKEDPENKKDTRILETLGEDSVYETINENTEQDNDNDNIDHGYELKFKHSSMI